VESRLTRRGTGDSVVLQADARRSEPSVDRPRTHSVAPVGRRAIRAVAADATCPRGYNPPP